jgi:hypothetical protein
MRDAPKNKAEAYRFLEANGAGFLANVVLTRHRAPGRRLRALSRLVLAGHQVGLSHGGADDLLVDGFGVQWLALDHQSTEEISAYVRRQQRLSEQPSSVATKGGEP